jgi:integrase
MPAQQFNFTKKALTELPPAAKGKRDQYRDQKYPHLYLQVTDRGTKSFHVYAWGSGRPQRVHLGKFEPNNSGGLSIEQARRKVAPNLKKIQGGQMPVAEKRAARQAETVKDLAVLYLEKHAKPKKKSWREDERQINHDILPNWRNKKVRDITRRDVTKLIDKIADRGAEIQARRTYRLISRMFKFGVGKAIIDSSPCVAIELPGKENRRTRALSAGEIKALWAKLDPDSDAISMDPRVRLLLRLVISTGQRVGECRQLEWADLDLESKWWTVPAAKRKRTEDSDTGDHRVFLNGHALDVLKVAKVISDGGQYVFPSPYADKPMTIEAISRAVSRNRKSLGVDDFQPRDLRRTVRTRMCEAGVSDFDAGRLQGHSLPGMSGTYNVHHYDETKSRAMRKWDRRLREIVSGKKDGKVVSLR